MLDFFFSFFQTCCRPVYFLVSRVDIRVAALRVHICTQSDTRVSVHVTLWVNARVLGILKAPSPRPLHYIPPLSDFVTTAPNVKRSTKTNVKARSWSNEWWRRF